MPGRVKPLPLLAVAMLLFGCSSGPAPVDVGGTGADMIQIGDNAWRVTAIDNTEDRAARIGTDQAVKFCAKRGQVPYFATSRNFNDMPARHTVTMDFQCMAGGTSPAARAEARMRGFQRDCAIAGFPLGSPENMNCAQELLSSADPKPADAP
jgi:hypothetical protein